MRRPVMQGTAAATDEDRHERRIREALQALGGLEATLQRLNIDVRTLRCRTTCDSHTHRINRH